jgi:hypothetical protein
VVPFAVGPVPAARSAAARSAAVTVPLGVVRSVAVTVASGTVSRDFGPGPDSAGGRKIEI